VELINDLGPLNSGEFAQIFCAIREMVHENNVKKFRTKNRYIIQNYSANSSQKWSVFGITELRF
jgi:hypothetical protein